MIDFTAGEIRPAFFLFVPTVHAIELFRSCILWLVCYLKGLIGA